jgi:hypothetical protein
VINIIERTKNFIDITIPVEEGVTSYRLLGHRTLMGAFGNNGADCVQFIQLRSGANFRSPALTRRGLGHVDEVHRGVTRVRFDIEEFSGGGNVLPSDDEFLFLRVQELHSAVGAWRFVNPIFIIPPWNFFSSPQPVITVSGVTGASKSGTLIEAAGNYPTDFDPATVGAGPLHFVLPRPFQTFSVTNPASAADAGDDELFVSFGPNQIPQIVNVAATDGLYGAFEKDVIVEARKANLPFSFSFAIANSG